MKKIFAAAAVALALTASAGAAFEKNNTYTPELFTDIPSTEWYASEVAGAYELGLMNGIGSNLFAPNGNVTVAEAITMASRAHALYLNETIPDASGEWYAKYFSYAKTAGIIADEFTAADFDRPATRSEVAELFRKAMSADWFTAVNTVSAIPDVPEDASFRDGLLLLYNAGIVMGSDSFGTFNPDANIIRAEAAAIINRVALPEKRLHKTLDKVSYSDAYLLAQSTTMSGSKEGIASGWLLDNRGGTPRKTLAEEGYSSLFDKDTEAGTAYIREFNKFSTGKVTLDTAFSAKGEGVYLEYRNDSGDAVYRAEIKDNAWQLLNADGSYTKLCDLGDTVNFTFYVTVDLDNLRSNTIINKKDCGTYPLSVSADKANILNFRFATTEKSTGMLTPGKTEMFVNYAVYDNFDYDEQDALPFDWTGDAVAKDYALLLEKGTAGKYFGAVSGTVVAEFEMLLPKNENVTYTLTHDGEAVAAFEAKDGVFTVNGTTVYTDAVANLWYRLRFELDTSSKTVLVKVNGRKAETVPFASKASSVSIFLLILFLSFDIKQCIDKFIRIKLLQIVNGFSYTNIFYRHMQLGLYRDCNAALSRSIHLCQNDSRKIRYLSKLPCLLQGVLSGCSVQHHQIFPVCLWKFLLNNAVNFFKLLHQVLLIMKSPRCIAQKHIRATRFGSMHCIKNNGCRVRAFLSAYDFYACTMRPLRKLLACSRTKGIGSR